MSAATGSGRGAGPAPSRRPLEVARAAWGLALLVAPHRVLAVAGEAAPDPARPRHRPRLGARHLVQAAVSGLTPGRAVLADGAWVDGIHALTSLALAVVDRRRRRLGLLDAAVAASWGLASRRAALQVPPSAGRPVERPARPRGPPPAAGGTAALTPSRPPRDRVRRRGPAPGTTR